jgi:hypothetical protein
MAFTPVRERGALGKLGHILQMSDPRYGALYAEQAQDYERQQGLAALAQQYPELAPLAQLGDPELVGKAYMAKMGMGGASSARVAAGQAYMQSYNAQNPGKPISLYQAMDRVARAYVPPGYTIDPETGESIPVPGLPAAQAAMEQPSLAQGVEYDAMKGVNAANIADASDAQARRRAAGMSSGPIQWPLPPVPGSGAPMPNMVSPSDVPLQEQAAFNAGLAGLGAMGDYLGDGSYPGEPPALQGGTPAPQAAPPNMPGDRPPSDAELAAAEAAAQVNPEGQKELVKGYAQNVQKLREDAINANKLINLNQNALNILDQGIISGTAGDARLTFGRALKTMGFNGAEDESSNTDAYIAQRAAAVGEIIKQFGSGTGLSDADREYAQKAAGGNIVMNEDAIRRILEISDKQNRWVIEQYNKEVSSIKEGGMFSAATRPIDTTQPAPTAQPAPGQTQTGGWSIRRLD